MDFNCWLCQHNLGQKALKLYDLMQVKVIHPNVVPLASIIKSYGNIGSDPRDHEAHIYVVLRGWDNDSMVGNNLVCMHAKYFVFLEVEQAFNKFQVLVVVP